MDYIILLLESIFQIKFSTNRDSGLSFADLVTVKNNNLSKLIAYGNQKWESILHFMVGTSGAPDEAVVKQLVEMKLMKTQKFKFTLSAVISTI